MRPVHAVVLARAGITGAEDVRPLRATAPASRARDVRAVPAGRPGSGAALRRAPRGPAAEAPPWLDGFAVRLAATRNASVAVGLLRELGRRLEHGHLPPAALLERCRRDGRRADGPLAKALEAFLVEQGLALRSDPTEQRAHHRRERLLTAVPAPLRAAAADFADAQLAARARAARDGTAMRSHDTIENDLAAVRDLARFLGEHIEGWEQVAVGHVETFLAARPALRARRLSSLRTFFRHCRRRRIVLTDATRGLRANFNPGFTGATVPVETQRRLFARWSGGEASGHESFVGLAALLHAASPAELKALCVEDVDAGARTLRLGRRPRPVPLDPATWEALQRCRHERERTGTTNPHLLVTRLTKTGAAPVSAYYLSHVLDPADVTIRALRSTRLAALVTTGGPVLVAEAIGLHPRAILYYARDHVDDARLFPDRA